MWVNLATAATRKQDSYRGYSLNNLNTHSRNHFCHKLQRTVGVVRHNIEWHTAMFDWASKKAVLVI